MTPRIHLIAPAGSCRGFLQALSESLHITHHNGATPPRTQTTHSVRDLVELVQGWVGSTYGVTARDELIDIEENDLVGGRNDDAQRAEDIQAALADDHVAAIVALRGGAWFTRILPRIDLSVLDRRSRPVAVFGFSELTTLVNIVAAHPMSRGVYDMGPAFLQYGLKRHAETVLHLPTGATDHPSAAEWTSRQLLPELRDYFGDVVSIIEGRGTKRNISARLISGDLSGQIETEFVGGNLCVLTTLLGSPYRQFIDPVGRWLVLEDLNEKPERIDRFLAHLTLAGFWEQCSGVLLGDFHQREQEQTSIVAAMLRFHLPPGRVIPVLVTRQIGHIWPMSPLPLRVPIAIQRRDESLMSLGWGSTALRVVDVDGKLGKAL